jgi:hypothetical protein
MVAAQTINPGDLDLAHFDTLRRPVDAAVGLLRKIAV